MKSYFRSNNCGPLPEQLTNCQRYINMLEEGYLAAKGYTPEAEQRMVEMADRIFADSKRNSELLQQVREENERHLEASGAYDQQQADALAARRG